jgi:Family of unknown function (DUF6165)
MKRGPVFEWITSELRKQVPAAPTQSVTIEVAPGELIDKITILKIKAERISDPEKLRNVRAELETLRAARVRMIAGSEELETLTAKLQSVNEALWEIEDKIRTCERNGDFGPKFIELARSVYKSNDRRAAIKRQINLLLGSGLIEEKSYSAAEPATARERPLTTGDGP